MCSLLAVNIILILFRNVFAKQIVPGNYGIRKQAKVVPLPLTYERRDVGHCFIGSVPGFSNVAKQSTTRQCCQTQSRFDSGNKGATMLRYRGIKIRKQAGKEKHTNSTYFVCDEGYVLYVGMLDSGLKLSPEDERTPRTNHKG